MMRGFGTTASGVIGTVGPVLPEAELLGVCVDADADTEAAAARCVIVAVVVSTEPQPTAGNRQVARTANNARRCVAGWMLGRTVRSIQ